MAKTVVCAACTREVLVHTTFNIAHPYCPNEGKVSGRVCPACSKATIWKVGKYSTFHACLDFFVCKGKVGSPRGKGAVQPKPPEPTVEEIMQVEVTPEVEATITEAQVTKQDTDVGDAAAKLLFGALGPLLSAEIDRRAGEIARKVVAEGGGKSVIYTWVDAKNHVVAKVEGGHKCLEQVVSLVNKGFKNVYLVGPAGSGKTTVGHDLAKALNCKFASISCTAGMSESKVIGRTIPNLTDGSNRFISTPFIDTYENGGVFLFDEIDAADPNMLLVINSALANGHMDLADRMETPAAKRHENCIVLCAANTYGNGADRQYVGRNQLDAAFLNRFSGAIVRVDYDLELEKAICSDKGILEKFWRVRLKASELKLRRIVGTRDLVSVVRHFKGGCKAPEAMSAVFSEDAGWTREELNKVGM